MTSAVKNYLTEVVCILLNMQHTESQRWYARNDFQQRDDVNWLKHSLYFREGNRLDYKPVRLKPLTVESFPLKPRVY